MIVAIISLARRDELRLQRGLEPFGRQAAPLQLRLEHGDPHLLDARCVERRARGRCRGRCAGWCDSRLRAPVLRLRA